MDILAFHILLTFQKFCHLNESLLNGESILIVRALDGPSSTSEQVHVSRNGRSGSTYLRNKHRLMPKQNRQLPIVLREERPIQIS